MAKIRVTTLLKALAAMDAAYAILDRQEPATPYQIGGARADLTVAGILIRAELGVLESVAIDRDDIDQCADMRGAEHPDDPRHGQAALINAGKV